MHGGRGPGAARIPQSRMPSTTSLPPRLIDAGRQLGAGLVVGIIGIIFAMTYGALLFTGPLERFLGYGVTVTLIALMVGSLFGFFSREKSLLAGPDSSSTSVLSSALVGLGALPLATSDVLHVALAVVFATALVCAATFRLLSRPMLANVVRFVPFPVMAGFLASTAWLLAGGAITIISGIPPTLEGMAALVRDPVRPELLVGFAVCALLFALASRLPGSVLMPVVIVATSLLVNLALASAPCAGVAMCEPSRWLFPAPPDVSWLPPWQLRLDGDMLRIVAGFLPTMLAAAFVSALAVMLAMASLEIDLRREFDLGHELRVHAGAAATGAVLGGMISSLSISRTVLNNRAGGGAFAGLVPAAMALAIMLGASQVMGMVARGALGGLVLYLALSMLKQWVWDVRRTARAVELLQIVLIVAITARHGFVVGFGAGVLIACVIFVVTYSRIPIAELATTLGRLRSSVVRSAAQEETLATFGGRVPVYRLSGYVFFGSASKIDLMFKERVAADAEAVVLDFSRVSGIDTSAIAILERILRRHADGPMRFHFVAGPSCRAQLRALADLPGAGRAIALHESLDIALEAAEENVIERHDPGELAQTLVGSLEALEGPSRFADYLETREVAENEVLCREGDRSDEVYFIESGRFEILKRVDRGEAPVRLSKVRHGAVVGELAFYSGEPRSATIVATRPSSVRVMHRAALERMRRERPELATKFDHMVIRSLSASLKRTSQMVASLA